jgi:crooked neck
MESARGPPRVKNKAASAIQISAEQLLREAVDRQEPGLQAPTQRFADLEELHEFQGRKRKEFEAYVQRNRINMNNSNVQDRSSKERLTWTPRVSLCGFVILKRK